MARRQSSGARRTGSVRREPARDAGRGRRCARAGGGGMVSVARARRGRPQRRAVAVGQCGRAPGGACLPRDRQDLADERAGGRQGHRGPDARPAGPRAVCDRRRRRPGGCGSAAGAAGEDPARLPRGGDCRGARDRAEARLEKAQTALTDTTLLAPSAGIISVRAREAGAIVQAGQTVYTLTLNDPVWIRAYVPQPRLGRIKPGMAVNLSIDSMPGKHYQGTVGFISPDAEFTPKSVQTDQVRDDLVYRIRVIASDPDDVFRQGMPVTVRVPAAQPALARNR